MCSAVMMLWGQIVPVGLSDKTLDCFHETSITISLSKWHRGLIWKQVNEFSCLNPAEKLVMSLTLHPPGSVSSPFRQRPGQWYPMSARSPWPCPSVTWELIVSLCTRSVSDLCVQRPRPAALSVASGIKSLIQREEQLFPDSAEDSRDTEQHRGWIISCCGHVKSYATEQLLIEPLDISISVMCLFLIQSFPGS